MKKLKTLLMSIAGLSAIVAPAVAVSCKDTKNPEQPGDTNTGSPVQADPEIAELDRIGERLAAKGSELFTFLPEKRQAVIDKLTKGEVRKRQLFFSNYNAQLATGAGRDYNVTEPSAEIKAVNSEKEIRFIKNGYMIANDVKPEYENKQGIQGASGWLNTVYNDSQGTVTIKFKVAKYVDDATPVKSSSKAFEVTLKLPAAPAATADSADKPA
ncbi:variable surface lipoprotein [Mycoplasma sp. 888]|uniref:variable surface lipoprotein n=1 Tax=Mycoplasma sp. 888 TaxID=3108483 RepID=UPI002D78B182|nr:variable surface lipoprotein [Mycoplasma sp. 888]WRQ25965.1 variable surface lipoprotein [Mycoplasma sp. 888]